MPTERHYGIQAMNIRPTRTASLQYVLTTFVVMILSTAATADQPGACCWEDVDGTWTCAYISDDDCLAIGGTWGGGGIPCDAIDCPPLGEVVGACCYITEGYGLYCAEINYLDCMANSGTYWETMLSATIHRLNCVVRVCIRTVPCARVSHSIKMPPTQTSWAPSLSRQPRHRFLEGRFSPCMTCPW